MVIYMLLLACASICVVLLKTAIASEWKCASDLLTLVVLSIVSIPWWAGGTYFGIEYEDAYEYQAAGALLLSANDWDAGLNPVCVAGTLDACEATASLSHPVGFSALLSMIYRVIGFNLKIAGAVSCASHIMTTTILYVFARRIASSRTAALCACLVWICSPAALVLATSSFSEPFGTFLLVMCLAVHSEVMRGRSNAATVISLAIILATSVMVRRDHLLLMMVLPVLSAAHRRGMQATICATLLSFITLLWIDPQILFVPGELHPAAAWFSMERIPATFKEMLMIWLNPFIFGAPVLGVAVICLSMNAWVSSIVFTWFAYVLMFSAFGQSYYYADGGEFPEVHARRYGYQIAPFASIVAGHGIALLISRYRYLKTRALFVGGIAVIAAHLQAARLKASLSFAETVGRLMPTYRTCDLVTDGALVTSEAILVQLLCPEIRVFSYMALESGMWRLWSTVR